MTKNKVSMREVSRLSGVSIATVSRIVHQNGRFSAETERRVLDVMKKLSYRPDPIAQGMRLKTLPVIGMIVPDLLDDRYGLILRLAQRRLFENGFSSCVLNANEDEQQVQSFITAMAAQRCSGLIYVPEAGAESIDLENIPTVFVERRPSFPVDVPSVQIVMNDREASCRAVKEMIRAGRRKIVLLGDSKRNSSSLERVAGAEQAIREAGLEPAAVLRVNLQKSSEAISAFRALLDQGTEADAVFCVTVRLTVGVLSILKERNIPGDQIEVLGIGEHRLCKYGLIQYRAVSEPLEEMAMAAVEALMDLIGGKQLDQSEQVFQCRA